MNELTRSVREFYERYPYPDTAGLQLRADAFPDWLLAQVDREPWPRQVQVLDAGCGTGAGLEGVAALNPSVRCVGVDLSEASIQRAAERLAGLRNVRLYAGDLMEPALQERLREEAPGGFDIVYLSGVLHHVVNPYALLQQLGTLLAPDGVMSIMVYAHYGRLPATRLREALRLARPEDEGGQRDLARALLQRLGPGPILRGPFEDAPGIGVVELADRYLHPHAKPLRVGELLGLLERAELRLLRWLEPRAWSPRALLGEGEAAEALEALDEATRAQVLEELFDHPALECLVTHVYRAERSPPEGDPLDWVVDRNPQVSWRLDSRAVGPVRLMEGRAARLRAGPWETVGEAEAALIAAIEGPIRGAELPLDPEVLRALLPELVRREWLYRVST